MSLKKIFRTPAESDLRMNAVEWALSRETDFKRYPEILRRADGMSIRVFKTDPMPSVRSIVVVFSVSPDDTKVSFHDAMESDDDPDIVPLGTQSSGPIAIPRTRT